MVPDQVLEAHEDGKAEERLLPREVPGGHCAGDGDVLAGDDELGDPEAAKDVVESHPGEERICGRIQISHYMRDLDIKHPFNFFIL